MPDPPRDLYPGLQVRKHPILTELDSVVKNLSPNALMWGIAIEHIRNILPHLQQNEKPVFAHRLLSGALDRIISMENELSKTSGSIYMHLRDLATVAAKLDKSSAQGAVFEQLVKAKTNFASEICNVMISSPEMASGEVAIEPLNVETMQFSYYNQLVQIRPPIKDAVRAIELLAGYSLLIEDKDGKPLAIVCPNLMSNPAHVIHHATVYSDLETFTKERYYGSAVSLDDIKKYIDDEKSSRALVNFVGDINLATFPLFGRVRQNKMLADRQTRDLTESIVKKFGRESIAIFQIEDDQHIVQILEMIDHLDKNDSQQGSDFARRLIKYVYFVGEFAYGSEIKGEKFSTAKLLEEKAKRQLQEASEVYRENGEMDYRDWPIIVYSFDALRETAISINAYNKGLGDVFPRKPMPPEFLLDLFDFSARHPQAKNIYQTFFDYVIMSQIILQEKMPLHQAYKHWKKWFYTEYNKSDVMSKDAPTTDPITDRLRAESLVIDAVNKGEAKGGLPRDLKVFFGGIGKGERFEGPFVDDLLKAGVNFTRMVGVDRLDFHDEYPQVLKDHHIDFVKADLSDESFALEEKFDLVVLPWSVVTDIILKKDLRVAMAKFAKLLSKNGMIIIDIPLPLGEKGYPPMIEVQLDLQQVLGIVEKGFQHGERTLNTLLNVMHIREIMMHAYGAGLIADNFPNEFDRQQAICADIIAYPDKLIQRHEEKSDETAVEYAPWEAKGWPRATLSLRNVGMEEIEKRMGLTPSLLVNLTGVGELMESQPEYTL